MNRDAKSQPVQVKVYTKKEMGVYELSQGRCINPGSLKEKIFVARDGVGREELKSIGVSYSTGNRGVKLVPDCRRMRK